MFEKAEAEELGVFIDRPILADDVEERGECVGLVKGVDRGLLQGGGDEGGEAEAWTVRF